MQTAPRPDNSLGSEASERPARSAAPTASGLGSSFKDVFDALSRQIESVIRGKRRAIHLALVCLFAEGHLLVEDVPGVGKTSLAKAIARSVGGTWRRIQFTPDLLPSDVTGVSVWNRTRGDFEFRPGGVFANVVLADEINRASPKTQSALLEAMEEQQVTVDAQTYPLPSPFLVIATQNPVELEGTYPLPEAQLDRFLLRLRIGYPDRDAELAILDAQDTSAIAPEDLEPVTDAHDRRRRGRSALGRVHVAPELQGYIVDIVEATPPPPRSPARREPARRARVAARGSRARREHRPLVRRARRREAARARRARAPAHALVGGDHARRERGRRARVDPRLRVRSRPPSRL